MSVEPREYGHSLLVEEPPLVVLPSLAQAIGLLEAVVLQQLHFLLRNPGNGKLIDGERWIFNSYRQWIDGYFPFVTESEMKRCFQKLERMSLLVSCQPEGVISRRKYYRINAGGLARIRSGRVQIPAEFAQNSERPNLTVRWPNLTLPITETTSETTLSKEAKESPTGKPVRRDPPLAGQQVASSRKAFSEGSKLTKHQLLERIKPRKGTPSFDRVQKHIETAQLDYVANSNAHEELRANKFHVWNEAKHRWEPVMHWKLFLEGLNAKILKAASAGREGQKRPSKRVLSSDEGSDSHQEPKKPRTTPFEPTSEPASAFLEALKQR